MDDGNEVTRFSQDMDGTMGPSEHGRWVRYEDFAAERARADAAEAERDAWRENVESIRAALSTERARAIEECALICDTTPPYPFRPSIEAAHAIRALAAKGE